jgi:hypothetical protein
MDETVTYYPARRDAVHAHVYEPLVAGVCTLDEDGAIVDFDVEGIADAVLGHKWGRGWYCKVAADEYWDIVAKHSR